jgi:hypothetical protein
MYNLQWIWVQICNGSIWTEIYLAIISIPIPVDSQVSLLKWGQEHPKNVKNHVGHAQTVLICHLNHISLNSQPFWMLKCTGSKTITCTHTHTCPYLWQVWKPLPFLWNSMALWPMVGYEYGYRFPNPTHIPTTSSVCMHIDQPYWHLLLKILLDDHSMVYVD